MTTDDETARPVSAVEPREWTPIAWVMSKQRVTARTTDGRPHASGTVVAYYDHPTVTIETDDGEKVHWMAHLTEVDPVDDPERDPVGTVRVKPGDPAAVPVLVIRTDDATSTPWRVFHGCWPGAFAAFGHAEVQGWEKRALADVAHLLRHDAVAGRDAAS